MNELGEVRLGPVDTPEQQQIAIRDLEAKVNELVRTLNEVILAVRSLQES